tara:strand:- start:116 stop:715 length:600 start_codon:yes stop_codon:yes gene_type:complete
MLFSSFSIAQTANDLELRLMDYDSLLQKRMYEIIVDDYQFLQLIETQNGKYKGIIKHCVWKLDNEEQGEKLIEKKINIPAELVKKLMDDLRLNNFENIPECTKEDGCITDLNGTTTYFNIYTDQINKSVSFLEIDPIYQLYRKSTIPFPVIQARKILELTYNEIDLRILFEGFKSKLPAGSYKFGFHDMKIKKFGKPGM